MDNGVVGIAGHIEDFQMGSLGSEAFGHVTAAHLRHHDICDQKMNLPQVPSTGHQRFDAMACLQHCVPLSGQGIAHQRPNRRFIFDDQQGFGPKR